MNIPTEKELLELLNRPYRKPTELEAKVFNLNIKEPIPLWLALTGSTSPYPPK